jgi:hypothetical protein
MIRAGFTDSALDDEAKQLVASAEALRSIDAAVESVLLVSAQAEVEVLQGKCQLLEQELGSSRSRWVGSRIVCWLGGGRCR